ncbi:MAG TPA: glycosyltransferase family 39 protein [Candidatus Brocadiia bacterium]|nr:glycosyltransferase family 39 protein [Candidatus Brocadiales bacterium]
MKAISLLKEQKYHTPVLSKSNVTILLCLIIFIAAFLRLYYLSAYSFLSDDIKTIETIEKGYVSATIEDAAKRGHPPFYFIILYYWTLIIGSNEFAIKIPSVMFGILSVFVLFKLASLIFDNKTALIGALLLAVNPEHFFCSYVLKQYTLTVLLGLVSVYLLLLALKSASGNPSPSAKDTSGGRTILWIVFNISNIALLCTHNSGIFVVLTEMVYIAIVFRKYKCGLQLFSSIVVICLSGVAIFLLQKGYSHSEVSTKLRWLGKPTLETFPYILSSFIAGLHIKIPKDQSPYISAELPVKIGFFVFFSCFLLLGIFKYFWGDKQKTISSTGNYKPLIYIWSTIPIASSCVISFLLWPIFGPTQYHLFWSCSILLLVAKGFAAIGKLRFICPALLIAVCIYLFPIITITKGNDPRKLNWKGVANYLLKNVSDGETVHVLDSDYVSLPLRYYYKEDVYIGISKVFEKMTSNVSGGRSKGVFLIEALESGLPVGWDRNLDMFYANKEVKQLYHIKVTHYWNQR